MAIIRNTLLIIGLFIIVPLAGCADFQQTAEGWGSPRVVNKAPVRTKPLPKNTTQSSSLAKLPPVKVAILLPLSGAQANIGNAMLQAAQLAVFDTGDNNFQLISRDTRGTASGASQAATSALNDGAQIIIGPLFSSSVRAVKAVAKPRNINVIAFSTDWTLADNSTYLMGFMPFSQVDRVAQFVTSKGYKNFALIAPKDKYGDLVSNRFKTKVSGNGAVIAKSIRYKQGDPTVINQIASLKDGNFQAVFMPVGGSQTEIISSALSYNKLMPNTTKRIGTGLWDDARIAQQSNMQGAWFAAPSPMARQLFERKYSTTYGQKPHRLATLAYDATALTATLAKNGFDRGGHPAFTRASITNPNGFAGTDGVFRFGANGIIERALSILEIRNGSIVEIDPAAKAF